MKKRKFLTIISCVLLLVVCASAGVVWWIKKPKDNDSQNGLSFKENMSDLMANVRMGNKDFVGFSLIGGKNKKTSSNNDNNGVLSVSLASGQEEENVVLPESSESVREDGLVVVDEDHNVEEIYFEKTESLETISLDDIYKYGVITNYGIMDGLLYVLIESHDWAQSSELKETGRFEIMGESMLFVVDLETRMVYSVNDSIEDLFGDLGNIWVTLENQFIGINLHLTGGCPEEYRGFYDIYIEDEKLTVTKFADISERYYEGRVVRDKYGNTYLVDDEHVEYDASKIDQEKFTILDLDEDYAYFFSEDKIIYRSLNPSLIRFDYVERLDANKMWVAENSSSDKLLRQGLINTESDWYVGGQYILVNGKIIKIFICAETDGFVSACYNFGGKIYFTMHMAGEDCLSYLCDIDDIDDSFYTIWINNENYDDYTKITSFENDTLHTLYLNIIQTGTGYILKKHDEKFSIIITSDGISLEKIIPIYNGVEFLNDIIYS